MVFNLGTPPAAFSPSYRVTFDVVSEELRALGVPDSIYAYSAKVDSQYSKLTLSVRLGHYDVVKFFRAWYESQRSITADLTVHTAQTKIHFRACQLISFSYTNNIYPLGNTRPELELLYQVMESSLSRACTSQSSSEIAAIEQELDEWLKDPYSFEKKREEGKVKYL
jgi:hypothetical protein